MRNMSKDKIYEWKGLATYMIVHFSSYRNKIAKGELINMYYEKKVPFCGLDQLIMCMDEIMDMDNLPEREFHPRCTENHRARIPDFLSQVHNTNIFFHPNEEDSHEEPSKNPKFISVAIHVYRRENGSMQGELRIADENIRFRSALELIRLLYECLEWRKSKRKEQMES